MALEANAMTLRFLPVSLVVMAVGFAVIDARIRAETRLPSRADLVCPF